MEKTRIKVEEVTSKPKHVLVREIPENSFFVLNDNLCYRTSQLSNRSTRQAIILSTGEVIAIDAYMLGLFVLSVKEVEILYTI